MNEVNKCCKIFKERLLASNTSVNHKLGRHIVSKCKKFAPFALVGKLKKRFDGV